MELAGCAIGCSGAILGPGVGTTSAPGTPEFDEEMREQAQQSGRMDEVTELASQRGVS